MRDTSQRTQVGDLSNQVAHLQNYLSTTAFLLEYPTVYKLNKHHKKRACYDDVGEFPQNIAEFYWVYCNPAEDKFYGICRLNCNLYAYFRLVDYGSFDEGSSKLIVSSSREQLIEYAMSRRAYRKYLKKTVPQL